MTTTFTVTTETRDQIALALVAHGDDGRVRVALGRRLKKVEHPICIAGIVRHWPADEDGRCRIPLNDVEGTMVWRAMAVYDMAAGRDIRSDLAGRLGVKVEEAFIYIRNFSRGCHAYNGTRKRHTDSHRKWTHGMLKLIDGDGHAMRGGVWNPVDPPHGDCWNHNIMFRAGLVLEPVIVDDTRFRPRASSLFLTPVPDVVPVSLSIADEDALKEFAV